MVSSTHLFAIIFQVFDKATTNLRAIENRMKAVGTIMNQASGQTKGFSSDMFKLGMGMTFFMFGIQMQLQRMLRQMFTTFEGVQGQNSVLMEGFNQIRASLGTISIAFFEAFGQSGMLETIVNLVNRLTMWFLSLTDNQRMFIVKGVIGFFVLSKVVSFLGQILLGVVLVLLLPVWALWGIGAIGAIIAIINQIKEFKKNMGLINEDLKTNSEIAWVSWKSKALDNIYTVIKWLIKATDLISWMTGGLIKNPLNTYLADLIQEKQNALRQVNELAKSVVDMSPSTIALKEGGYVEGLGYVVAGGGQVYPTNNPNFVPQMYMSQGEKDLQQAQLSIQQNQLGSLNKIYESIGQLGTIFAKGFEVKLEGQTYSSVTM